MAKVRKNVYIRPEHKDLEDLDELIRSMLELGAKIRSDPEMARAVDLARQKQPGIIGLESLIGWIVVDWLRLREDSNGGRMFVINEARDFSAKAASDTGEILSILRGGEIG